MIEVELRYGEQIAIGEARMSLENIHEGVRCWLGVTAPREVLVDRAEIRSRPDYDGHRKRLGRGRAGR